MVSFSELVGRQHLHDFSIHKQTDNISDPLNLFDTVRDNNDGHATVLLELNEHVLNVLGRYRV